MNISNINIGDVVFCRNGFFIVVATSARGTVLCPLVGCSELRHRADLDLSLLDIAEANLPSPYMRVRAVPRVYRKGPLVRLGSVPWACADLISKRMTHELRQRDRQGP